MATTMKAWQYSAIVDGLEKSLTLNEAAYPPDKTALSKNEVLVEVITASLNPADYKIPEMPVAGRLMISTPASPGMDFCGRVVATHNTNDSLKKGTKVFGKLGAPSKYGSCGQYMVVNLDGCVALPEGVDADDAACIGTAGITAFQCIAPNVQAGSEVFINGGSGGTGTFGIQIAKALGAKVTVTCSTANIGFCKELGASEVIDYKTQDVLEVLKAKGPVFDLAVDNVGTPMTLYKESYNFIKPTGKFVQVGAETSMAGVKNLMGRMMQPSWLGGGKRAFQFLSAANKKDDFEQIVKWMGEGKVKAVIDEAFEWEDVPKAYEKLKTGRVKGKLVVHVTPE